MPLTIAKFQEGKFLSCTSKVAHRSILKINIPCLQKGISKTGGRSPACDAFASGHCDRGRKKKETDVIGDLSAES